MKIPTILIYFISFINLVQAIYNVSSTEVEALYDLYNTTNGDHWDWKDAKIFGKIWNFSEPNPNPCNENWQGISCNSDCALIQCTLTHLNLNGYRLYGTLPSSLTMLTNLMELSLGTNFLEGPFPEFIGEMITLHTLDLSITNMTGSLPISYGNLKKLDVLSMFKNGLTGSFPGSYCNLTNIRRFEIDVNRLVGTLPTCLNNFTKLEYFSASYNNFTGDLPQFINSVNITFLELNVNKFNGTIPSNYGNFQQLSGLYLFNNSLIGSIPSSLGDLINLNELILAYNELTGSIPLSFSKLVNIKNFYLGSNHLTGPIPNELTTMSTLRYFEVFDNQLTGTIPVALGDITTLFYFDVSENLLTGPLPSTFGTPRDLHYFHVHVNSLTGPLPASLASLPRLQEFKIDYNLFSQSFPAEYSQMSFMIYFSGTYNFLDSSFAFSFDEWTNIEAFIFNNNFFTGLLPYSLYNLRNIETLYLQSNYFTGSLPTSTVTISTLSDMNFSSNLLSGSIPESFLLNRELMANVDISSNYLTGSITNQMFSTCQFLDQLFLENNQFKGNLYELINTTLQVNISNIDISNNQFTGTLPESIFTARLNSFAAVKNCITGSIPKTICSNHQLQALALDGLYTADSCTRNFFPAFMHISSYPLAHPLKGDLPSCLFSLPSLQTLHLSGNGLKGSLWDDIVISSELSDLTLSHNLLTGTIPNQFQEKEWKNFDLSFNKFTGHLTDKMYSFSSNSSKLELKVNRLSGHIPSVIKQSPDISILQGNAFSCSYQHRTSSLPSNDPDNLHYKCGSNDVNAVLFTWIALFGFFCLTIYLAYYIRMGSASSDRNTLVDRMRSTLHNNYAELHAWFSIYSETSHTTINPSNKTPNFSTTPTGYPKLNPQPSSESSEFIREFGFILNMFRTFALHLTLVILFLLLPIYCILTALYGTYQDQYAYTISFIYISGLTPAIILFLVLFCLSIYIRRNLAILQLFSFVPLELQMRSSSSSEGSRSAFLSTRLTSISSILSHSTLSQMIFRNSIYFKVIGCILLNVIVVMSVNIAFVYASVAKIPNGWHVFLTFCMPVFKIIWNNSFLLDTIANYLKEDPYIRQQDKKKHSLMVLLLNLILFNYIFAPFISEAFISSDCFYYMIAPASAVKSSYSFPYCEASYYLQVKDSVTVQLCESYTTETHTTSYSPPFIYSNQCSSSFLTNFSIVFILRYLGSGIIVPTYFLMIKVLQEYRFRVLYDSFTSILKRQQLMAPGSTLTTPSEANSPLSSSLPNSSNMTNLSDFTRQNLFPWYERLLYNTLPKALRILAPAQATWFGISLSSPQPTSTGSNLNPSDTLTEIPQPTNDFSSYSFEWQDSGRCVFERDRYLIIILGDIAVFLTFGVTFPPIAVTICVSIIVNTLFTQFMHGRLVTLSKNFDQFKRYVTQINEECQGASQIVLISLPWIAMITSTFWAFFLYDTLGDQQDIQALWIFFLTCSIPVILSFGERFYLGQSIFHQLFCPKTTDPLYLPDIENDINPVSAIENPLNKGSNSRNTLTERDLEEKRSIQIELRSSTLSLVQSDVSPSNQDSLSTTNTNKLELDVIEEQDNEDEDN